MPSIPRAPISLQQIAAAANVSATTVSLALRNHRRISSATRQRIQALAQQMGYRPDPSVATLMSQLRLGRPVRYRETLAWINAYESRDYFFNEKLVDAEYCQSLWKGASERAEELGYVLEVFWLKEPHMTGRRMTAILAARGIRGVMIPPLPQASGHITLDWQKFASVALSYTIARPLFHRVVPDHHHNIQMILRTLRHRGYKKIGLLVPARYEERIEHRFRSAFCFYQESIDPGNRIPPFLSNSAEIEAPCAAWLKKYRPEVVISLGGVRDINKIDVGDSSYSSKLGVVLMGHSAADTESTAVDENPFRIGVAAVNHLAGQLSRNEVGIPDCPETVLIQGTWIEGRTLPCSIRALMDKATQ